MTFDAYTTEKNMKWAGGTGKERKEFQMERDDAIVQLVNTHRVVTSRLMVALLGLENTPSNLTIVDRRLNILAEEKNFRKVVHEGIVYFVSFVVSMRKTGARAQLMHRHMQSWFWGTLFCAVSVEMHKTDTELHAEKGPVIPDGFFRTRGAYFFLECNTGREHDFEKIVAKATTYHRQQRYLCSTFVTERGQEPPEFFRVLWVNRSAVRAERMLTRFREIGGGELYLIADEKAIDPFHPETLVHCWRSPKTGRVPSLLEGQSCMSCSSNI
jgi:hypothetical protein